jgi:hypothetical protein
MSALVAGRTSEKIAVVWEPRSRLKPARRLAPQAADRRGTAVGGRLTLL